jgi:hypothetical protein
VTEASVRCEKDQLATPQEWKAGRRVVAKDGTVFAELSLAFGGTLADGELVTTVLPESATVETSRTRSVVPLAIGPLQQCGEGRGEAEGWSVAPAILPSTVGVAMNFGLFEAVQRLPKENLEPVQFTMIDDFDLLRQGYVLSLRGTEEVLFGEPAPDKVPTPLYAFNQTGEGCIETVYWLDQKGRLLFVSAGIESYIRDAVPQTPEGGKVE